ncbi:hypothetical protein ACFQPF_15780 [Fictibacillus iocasae]|uniref:LTD domain-containing protein n=1 Tax=Fictibacillus iocasae TaxID=2715437 RepID=A0ABW2NTI7_9BACL
MMIMQLLTTGAIENSSVNGLRPTNEVIIILKNNDGNNAVNIQGYYLTDTQNQYVQEVFSMVPYQVSIREYQTQFDAFEFKFSVESGTDIDISVWGKDAEGNLVASHRLVPAELSVVQSATTAVTTANANLIGVDAPLDSQFSDLRVAQKSAQFEVKSVYGITFLRDETAGVAGGDVTNDGTLYYVSTSSNPASYARLQTAERGRYIPGRAAEASIGLLITQLPQGDQIIRWGYFDDLDGFFFGVNANGYFIGIRRQGMDLIIPRSEWNVDPLDGTGPSRQSIDLGTGHIFIITYSWGFGTVSFRIAASEPSNGTNQEVFILHNFDPPDTTTIQDPNQPVRIEVVNNGTALPLTVPVAGRSYSIIGEDTPQYRITSERRSVTVETEYFPILAFRRKTTFPPGTRRPNTVTLRLEGVDLAPTAPMFYEIRIGADVDGVYEPFPTRTTLIQPNETALEVNNNCTEVNGGYVAFQGLSAGGGSPRVLTSQDLQDLVIPFNVSIVLVGATFSGQSTVNAVLRIREEW